MTETISEIIQNAVYDYFEQHGKKPKILVLNELSYLILYKELGITYLDLTVYKDMEISVLKKHFEQGVIRIGVG